MTDVLFVVTHLFGIGHLKRAAALARACAARGLSVALVSGGRPLRHLELGRARLIQLEPWLRSRDESFAALIGPGDRPLDAALQAARRARLLEILEAEAPRVLVTEHYPFGRRKLRFELEPLLCAARARRPRPWLVASVRDLLVRKPAEKTAWMAEAAAAYDRILVHGDPALIPFEASFAQTAALGERLTYSGYVLEAGRPLRRPPRGEVLVSAGGGAFGLALLTSALVARPASRARDLPWRLLVGDNLPEADFLALRRAAPAGVKVQRARPDFPARLQTCALSISQGGYNTTVAVLHAGCPAVIVPYEADGQSEQRERAELLARRGWLTCAAGGDRDPLALAAAIDRSLAAPAPAGRPDLSGAATTAEILRDLAAIVPPA